MNIWTKVIRKGNELAAPYYLSSPKVIECNVCGWEGKRFLSNDWHPHVVCPKCGSEVRHRLLLAAISQIDTLSHEKIISGKRILHFAPESMLERKFRTFSPAKYLTADFNRKEVDLKLDISNMSSIQNDEFDLAIACDVLEHVSDHIKAMNEIYRILSSGGYAILTVPQKDRLKITFEDPSVVDPKERERLFGQADHVRIYGEDFASFLEKAGFEVTVIDEGNLAKALVEKYVLFPPKLSNNSLATNYRRIFFARKKPNS